MNNIEAPFTTLQNAKIICFLDATNTNNVDVAITYLDGEEWDLEDALMDFRAYHGVRAYHGIKASI